MVVTASRRRLTLEQEGAEESFLPRRRRPEGAAGIKGKVVESLKVGKSWLPGGGVPSRTGDGRGEPWPVTEEGYHVSAVA